MNRKLQRTNILYHRVDGKRVEGPHAQLTGDTSGLWGCVSPGLRVEVSGLRGNVTGLRGHVTGLRGCVSGLWGNIDDCGLTDEDRERGVDIANLVQ